MIYEVNSLRYIHNAHGDVVKYINSTGVAQKSFTEKLCSCKKDPVTQWR